MQVKQLEKAVTKELTEQLNKINDYYNNLKSVNANSIIKKQTETKTSIGRDKK